MKLARTALLLAALGLAACSKPSTGEPGAAKADESAKAAAAKASASDLAASASASSTVAPAPRPATSGSGAASKHKLEGLGANEADVSRYEDEKKLATPAKQKIVAAYYTARVEPTGSAKSVAVLPKDTEVTVVAERGMHQLITFANPDKSSETLVGWIFKMAFDEKSLAGCPSAGVMVDAPTTGAFCAKPCSPDKACPAGQKCFHGACMKSE